MSKAIEEFDKELKREIYFNKMNYDLDKESKDLEKIVSLILLYLDRGYKLSKIRKLIQKYKFRKSFYSKIESIMRTQSKVISSSKGIGLGSRSILGLTFYGNIKEREVILKKRMRILTNELIDAIKAGVGKKDILNRFLKKEKNNNRILVEMLTKRSREYAYDKEDSKKELKGWVSMAVLDNRTSRICSILHGVFYSKKKYQSRFDIPYLPPRHPNCRSYISAVDKDTDVNDYIKEDLNSFLKRNRDVGIELLGEKKYNYFIESKKSIVKFIDFKKLDYLTNEAIEKKLI